MKYQCLTRQLNRRDLLKTGLAAMGGILSPGPVTRFIQPVHAMVHADIAVARGTPPSAAVDAVLNALGGMKRFIGRGDVVVIKPNIAWDRRPEFAANTNPAVVAALVRQCFAAGAIAVKVFDRSCSDARRSYRQSGIAEAAEAEGALVTYTDDRKFREVTIKGRALTRWPLYNEILEADKVINVPIAKTHGIAGLTLGMKNWMGVMGGWRGRIHQRLNESIVDLAGVVRPTLTIMDAVRILVANGPQGGRLEDVRTTNTIIGGADPVAVDTLTTALFGMKPDDLPYLAMAQEDGLGSMNLSERIIANIEL